MPEEPTNWELMRSINGLQRQISDMSEGMMTAKMFELSQRGTDQRFASVEKAVAEEKAARAEQISQINSRLTDAQNFRRNIYLGVGIAFLTAILSILVTLVRVAPV